MKCGELIVRVRNVYNRVLLPKGRRAADCVIDVHQLPLEGMGVYVDLLRDTHQHHRSPFVSPYPSSANSKKP